MRLVTHLDVDRAAQRVFQPAVEKVGRRLPVVGRQDRRGEVAQACRHRLDLLVECGGERVVALRGDRDEVAQPCDLGGQRLVRLPDVELHGLEVALQVRADRGHVAAQIAQQIEDDDVEIALPVGVGREEASDQRPDDAQQPLVQRPPRTVSDVGLPHLAPRIGAGGWGVDRPIVHGCGAAGSSSKDSTPCGSTST